MGNDSKPPPPPHQPEHYAAPGSQPANYQAPFAQPPPQPVAYTGYPAQGQPQPMAVQYMPQMQPPVMQQTDQVQVTHIINGVPVTAGPGKNITIEDETYCGPITWIIGIFVLPCICCCPVDRRQKITTSEAGLTTVRYSA